MNTKKILLFSLCFGLLIGHNSYAFSDKIIDQVQEMSLEEKIGQMLLIGFRGYTADENSQIARDIKNYYIGSVILFDRDAALGTNTRNVKSLKQVKKLNQQLQSYSKQPLFISIDQEGGMVTRLKPRHGFHTTPSHEKLGQSSTQKTKKESSKMATGLNQLGINLNFAPVVDVNVNPKNPIIGHIGRSFSEDPYKVTDHAQAFIKGHNQSNVATVLKHFPGHGSSQEDSHIGFTDITNSWNTDELIPFAEIIQSKNVNMIMSAHVFNKNLDPNHPATLSYNVMTNILRGELGFEGVVISDDMNMGAIKDHYDLNESIILAINAGVDILLFGNNLVFDKNIASKAHNIILKAIESGKISKTRINQSVKRVLQLKDELSL